MSGIRCTAKWNGKRCESRAGACKIGRSGPLCFECYHRRLNIPIAPCPDSCQIPEHGMSDVRAPTDIEKLQARVAKMRELGVTRWGDIELGPEPPSAETDATQRTTAPDEKADARAAQRRSFGASGGWVKSAGKP